MRPSRVSGRAAVVVAVGAALAAGLAAYGAAVPPSRPVGTGETAREVTSHPARARAASGGKTLGAGGWGLATCRGTC